MSSASNHFMQPSSSLMTPFPLAAGPLPLSDQPNRNKHAGTACRCTMRFGSTAKVLLKCKLKYYRISECVAGLSAYACGMHILIWAASNMFL